MEHGSRPNTVRAVQMIICRWIHQPWSILKACPTVRFTLSGFIDSEIYSLLTALECDEVHFVPHYRLATPLLSMLICYRTVGGLKPYKYLIYY